MPFGKAGEGWQRVDSRASGSKCGEYRWSGRDLAGQCWAPSLWQAVWWALAVESTLKMIVSLRSRGTKFMDKLFMVAEYYELYTVIFTLWSSHCEPHRALHLEKCTRPRCEWVANGWYSLSVTHWLPQSANLLQAIGYKQLATNRLDKLWQTTKLWNWFNETAWCGGLVSRFF